MNVDIKKYLKKLIAMGALSFVLVTTGCSSKENNAEPENEVTTEVENSNEQENTTNDNDVQETENNSKDTNNEEATEDNAIVKYFEDKNEEMDNLIYTDNIKAADEFWSEYFIDAVDIIFYDKEYEGSSFSELDPEAQQKCIDELQEVENKMNKINPNWKDDLGNIKDSTAEAYSNLLDSIEELIGTDNYNKIKDFKDSLKDSLSDIGNSLKDSANNWYQGYKSKNK